MIDLQKLIKRLGGEVVRKGRGWILYETATRDRYTAFNVGGYGYIFTTKEIARGRERAKKFED